MQRALLQYKRPENRNLVREALIKAGREDLIGYGGDCLVAPDGRGMAGAKQMRNAECGIRNEKGSAKQMRNGRGGSTAKKEAQGTRGRSSANGKPAQKNSKGKKAPKYNKK
jgi:hypothetical protein